MSLLASLAPLVSPFANNVEALAEVRKEIKRNYRMKFNPINDFHSTEPKSTSRWGRVEAKLGEIDAHGKHSIIKVSVGAAFEFDFSCHYTISALEKITFSHTGSQRENQTATQWKL